MLDFYRVLGDHQQAIKIWEEKTLKVYTSELGEHPWTGTILLFIAESYKVFGDEKINSAVEYSRKALELRIKLLDVHQDTAQSHVILSDALEIQKDFQAALKELEAAFEIQKEVLGEDHESTKETRTKMKRISDTISESNNCLCFKHLLL